MAVMVVDEAVVEVVTVAAVAAIATTIASNANHAGSFAGAALRGRPVSHNPILGTTNLLSKGGGTGVPPLTITSSLRE